MENASLWKTHTPTASRAPKLSLSLSPYIYIYYIDRERERDRDGEARSADWSMHETVALAAFGDGA